VRRLVYEYISYISVYVRRRIGVGTVLGYNVSGGRVRLSARLSDTSGVSGVMTRAFGGSTELSTELSEQSGTYTNHRVNGSWMESVYLMSIRDSGLVWTTVHTGPDLCIIATMACNTFFRILGVAYDGGQVAWILWYEYPVSAGYCQ